jgi:vacuolar-type H+-ATPase subunit B/Vma2
MPVVKRGKKYGIGKGKARYKSKASANRAYKAYRAKKHSKKGR